MLGPSQRYLDLEPGLQVMEEEVTYLCQTSRQKKSYARDFSEIPGPRAWPLGIGRGYLLMPDHQVGEEHCYTWPLGRRRALLHLTSRQEKSTVTPDLQIEEKHCYVSQDDTFMPSLLVKVGFIINLWRCLLKQIDLQQKLRVFNTLIYSQWAAHWSTVSGPGARRPIIWLYQGREDIYLTHGTTIVFFAFS